MKVILQDEYHAVIYHHSNFNNYTFVYVIKLISNNN